MGTRNLEIRIRRDRYWTPQLHAKRTTNPATTVGRTIVSSSDDYKVYRMTGEEDEEDEPVDGVYMTIEGGSRKTSITPPLLL